MSGIGGVLQRSPKTRQITLGYRETCLVFIKSIELVWEGCSICEVCGRSHFVPTFLVKDYWWGLQDFQIVLEEAAMTALLELI